MPKSAISNQDGSKSTFVLMAENFGLTPLPHYFEEIYANLTGIKKLGMRGDRNYVFYSKNGVGQAYNEETEMQLSAKSAYEYLRNPTNAEVFFASCQSVINDIHEEIKFIEKLDFASQSTRDLGALFISLTYLHGWCFSHFIVSQPFRLALFEQEIKDELKKRVAKSKIDVYMAELTASSEQSTISREEVDWLTLVIQNRQVASDDPRVKKLLSSHFEQYKTLSLGDGVWRYDPKQYYSKFVIDAQKPLDQLQARLHDIVGQSEAIKARKQELSRVLYLDPHTVSVANLLARIGHGRLMLRIEGWIPLVKANIEIGEELAKRIGYKNSSNLNYLSIEELEAAVESGRYPSEDNLEARRSTNEFLMQNQDGVYKIFYGAEAACLKGSLIAEVNHSEHIEVEGNVAMVGLIEGTALLYNWGDDITEAADLMKSHQILVAGQTRPAMMPIIRNAQGIVTDEGGVTSHAAIVAREMGIPAVINTQSATKIFKTGDHILLDANTGLVKKLS